MKKYDKNSYTEYNEKTDKFDSTQYIWGGGDYAPFYTEDEDYDINKYDSLRFINTTPINISFEDVEADFDSVFQSFVTLGENHLFLNEDKRYLSVCCEVYIRKAISCLNQS